MEALEASANAEAEALQTRQAAPQEASARGDGGAALQQELEAAQRVAGASSGKPVEPPQPPGGGARGLESRENARDGSGATPSGDPSPSGKT